MTKQRFTNALLWMGLSLGVLSGTSCGQSPPPSPSSGDPPEVCRRWCEPGCLHGFMCVIPNSLQEYTAFCAPPCTTNADCGSLRCASLFNQPGTPAVCVAPNIPERCPGVAEDPSWHCDFPPATCKSAQVLMKGFSQPQNRVCGTEYIHCQNGCTDPGTLGSGAYCK